jgi:hypothetical protein
MLTQERIKTLAGSVSYEINGPLLALYKHAHKGDWDATKNYLHQYPNAKKAKIKPYGGTALHVAASAGNLTIVEELVKMMSEEELEIQDDEGSTALFSAATVGITKMAECLVSKNKNLVTFVNAQKKIPLVQACISDCKDMALYLYSVTPFEFLRQDNGNHGSYFLQCAIGAQMLGKRLYPLITYFPFFVYLFSCFFHKFSLSSKLLFISCNLIKLINQSIIMVLKLYES